MEGQGKITLPCRICWGNGRWKIKTYFDDISEGIESHDLTNNHLVVGEVLHQKQSEKYKHSETAGHFKPRLKDDSNCSWQQVAVLRLKLSFPAPEF